METTLLALLLSRDMADNESLEISDFSTGSEKDFIS